MYSILPNCPLSFQNPTTKLYATKNIKINWLMDDKNKFARDQNVIKWNQYAHSDMLQSKAIIKIGWDYNFFKRMSAEWENHKRYIKPIWYTIHSFFFLLSFHFSQSLSSLFAINFSHFFFCFAPILRLLQLHRHCITIHFHHDFHYNHLKRYNSFVHSRRWM